MGFLEILESIGKAVDVAGVAAIVLGATLATLIAADALLRTGARDGVYHRYRRGLGRSILLGLELLVAADIIRTVAVTPTFQSVGVLGVIVLIRTFLSFSLELEITGRWPWQKAPETENLPVPGRAAGSSDATRKSAPTDDEDVAQQR
ncbi:hypothetical protein GCM10011374_41530 [Kocuria dechangensis]|uniref:DUF1622 domain-containing protein n=1 Tax=Kocuria dechangensis TaxID=1176249 RepID=A0A917M3C3_9MICC|nr:DUF1622 domain-containing protein [Kocuria dechangensis]GGG72488.1 hypothetical protein GCM10011374_41530 [Kocuria dechangensis]